MTQLRKETLDVIRSPKQFSFYILKLYLLQSLPPSRGLCAAIVADCRCVGQSGQSGGTVQCPYSKGFRVVTIAFTAEFAKFSQGHPSFRVLNSHGLQLNVLRRSKAT